MPKKATKKTKTKKPARKKVKAKKRVAPSGDRVSSTEIRKLRAELQDARAINEHVAGLLREALESLDDGQKILTKTRDFLGTQRSR